jgi:uncharacterized repeat protein (TIGR01451 family)
LWHLTLPGGKIIVNVPANGRPWGDAVDADVQDLAPGASQVLELPVKAMQAGRHTIKAEIQSRQKTVASTQITIDVGKAGIGLRRAGASRILLNHDGEMQVEVTNHQDSMARNVLVTETLPDGLEFIAASEGGIYRPETRTVNWVVDRLASHEARMLSVQVRAVQTGDGQVQIVARGQRAEDVVEDSGIIAVGGAAALDLRVHGRDAALEVGKETVYEVRVHNAGNATATDVLVRAELPEGMQARAVDGPTRHQVEGNQVVFAPVATMHAGREVIYRIGVVAQRAGDCRMRVQLSSAQMSSPLTREERTLVYQD